MATYISLANDVLHLARGSQNPQDPQYIESYFKVFEAAKIIIQGDYGFIKFVKSKMDSANFNCTDYEVSGLDKKSIYSYLSNYYEKNIYSGRGISTYVDETSLALYAAVIGRERVVLTDIENNMRAYHAEITAELNGQKKSNWSRVDSKKSRSDDPLEDIYTKKNYLDNFIYLFDEYRNPSIASLMEPNARITIKDIEFLCLFLGKVIEGSLSQGRKSKGGDIAEKIVEVLIQKNGLNVNPQVKEAATNTDLVVTHLDKKYCIAVQLSTNDRMRLSSDEFHKDSTKNYLVSLNGCQVSRKNIADISFQRMANWMESEIISGESIAYFVGIESFINQIRNTYLNALNNLLISNQYAVIDESILDGSDIDTLRGYLVKLASFPEIKDKFLLALWAYRKAMSFEEFINQIRF